MSLFLLKNVPFQHGYQLNGSPVHTSFLFLIDIFVEHHCTVLKHLFDMLPQKTRTGPSFYSNYTKVCKQISTSFLILCHSLWWPVIGIDGWPFVSPLLSFLRIDLRADDPPLSSKRLFLNISIIGHSCIYLSVNASWYEVAGCRGTEGISAPSSLSPHFTFFYSFTVLASSLLFWLFESFVAHLSSKNSIDIVHVFTFFF